MKKIRNAARETVPAVSGSKREYERTGIIFDNLFDKTRSPEEDQLFDWLEDDERRTFKPISAASPVELLKIPMTENYLRQSDSAGIFGTQKRRFRNDFRLMAKKNYQFWIFYAAAWSLYAASLGAVFVGVGNRLDFNLPLTILCNVAPAALLGLLVFQICEKLNWNERERPKFILIHFFSLLLFTISWCFLTLLCLSVLSSVQRGAWVFVRWDNFALLWQLFSGVMIYLTIASAVYVKQTGESLRIEERRNAELEIRAVRAESARASAELAALRAQFNPHFLFNTLHSLMALVRTDAEAAEAAIEQFAAMLRYVLHSQQEDRTVSADVTFAEEWNFVQNYLELERLRLGERLHLTTKIEPVALGFYLPAFTLQPIVENAVKHAIAPRSKGGRLCITAQTDSDNNLIIEVSDDGTTSNLIGGKQNNNGLGLRLVRESLAARFGSAARLKTELVPNEGFKVLITIPKTNSSGVNSNVSADER